MLRKLIQACILTIIIFLALPSFAQNTNQQNFSNLRVDELSDDQIRQFIRQVESTGLTDAQLEQVAAARGMRPEEIQKLFSLRPDDARRCTTSPVAAGWRPGSSRWPPAAPARRAR